MKSGIDKMTGAIQIGVTVQRGTESSLQNVCAKSFEIECQPVRVTSLNTSSRPYARMWAGPFLISPVLAKTKAGLFPRRTAAENYLDPSVLVGSVTESPKKQLRRATARRSAVDGSFRALGHDVICQSVQGGSKPLAGSRSSRIERELNHRAIWLGGVWHQSANTDTSRPICR